MTRSQRIVLLARFAGDLCVRVVDVDATATIAEVAAASAALTLGRHVRYPSPDRPLVVRRSTPGDEAPPLAPHLTVTAAGLSHLDCLDVYHQ